jgi:pimeloyl-ACP methyl ester carboxylesterase
MWAAFVDMAIAFLASCLVGVGFWQALAACADWPGLSIAGPRRRLGGAIGALLLTIAVGLAILGNALLPVLILLIPCSVVGFALSVAAGTLAGRRAKRGASLIRPESAGSCQVETVSIRVSLPHHHPAVTETVIAPTSLVMRRDGVPIGPADPVSSLPGTLVRPMGACRGAILLVCGAGDNRSAFKGPLLGALSARDFAVLSIDPPGHGAFMAVPTTVENTQTAAMAALDWLSKQFPTQPIGVIGVSFGGNQVVWLAAHEARVSAVVLISTPVSLKPVRRRTIVREGVAMLLPANLGVFRWGSAGDFYRGWRSMKGYAAGPETLYRMIDRLDTCRWIATLGDRPILLAHGRADVAVPFDNARILAAAAPRASLLPVTHGTHLTIILRPEVVSHIADWLAVHLRETAAAQPGSPAAV